VRGREPQQRPVLHPRDELPELRARERVARVEAVGDLRPQRTALELDCVVGELRRVPVEQ
jgi:hypothetical protein